MELVLPIGEVARRFRIRASALRYYDEIALLKPALRQSSRRYYGPAELRRLALIQLLQDTGRLTLEQIADILIASRGGKSSRQVLTEQVAALEEQVQSATAAKRYLKHRLSCPRDDPFDGCTVLAAELEQRLRSAGYQADR